MTDMMSMINTIWPFLVMGLMFYFLLYRPQKKEQNKRQTMLGSLKVGTRIVTIGGIMGEITKIHDDRITLKVADNVEIKIIKSAVGHLQEKQAPQPKQAKKQEKQVKQEKVEKVEKTEQPQQPEKPAEAAQSEQGEKK